MWLDQEVSKWVLENISQKNEFIGKISAFLSNINSFGQMWILILLGLLVYEYIKTRKFKFEYIILLLVIVIGWCFVEFGLKNLVGRTRPFQDIPEFKTYMDSISYKYPSGCSFPSGHTFVSFAAAYSLAHYYKKFNYVFYILSSAIGLSRIILGAHYFSDVLAGLALGILFVSIAVILSEKFKIHMDKLKRNETR